MTNEPIRREQIIGAVPGYFLITGPAESDASRIIAWRWDGLVLLPIIDHGKGYAPEPVGIADLQETGAEIVFRPVGMWVR